MNANTVKVNIMKLKELIGNLYKNHPDKVGHFIVIFTATMVAYTFMNLLVAVSAAVLLSVGKELFDWKFKTTGFSKKDLMADFTGMSVAIIIIFILDAPAGGIHIW